MRTDQYLVALALVVSTFSASAATVCVQNKQTGKYAPKNAADDPAECASMNKVATDAIALVTNPGAPAARPPMTAPAVSTAAVPSVASAAPIVTAVAPPPAPADPAAQRRTYQLKFSDVTVRLAVQRWFKDVKMQLAYEAGKDFPVPVEGDYAGTISDVVKGLMTSLSESSYPLRACEYDNRVVLVVHRDEKCPLEER